MYIKKIAWYMLVSFNLTLRFHCVLQACARKAISSATQCITAAQASHEYNSNAATREGLMQDTRELSNQIPPLVDAIKMNGASPDDTNAQSELMYVAEVFLHVSLLLITV